jgi:hypothetical protein
MSKRSFLSARRFRQCRRGHSCQREGFDNVEALIFASGKVSTMSKRSFLSAGRFRQCRKGHSCRRDDFDNVEEGTCQARKAILQLKIENEEKCVHHCEERNDEAIRKKQYSGLTTSSSFGCSCAGMACPCAAFCSLLQHLI